MFSNLPEFVAREWPLLLTTALGGVAVYLLLPRARRFPPALGAVIGGLAIFAGGQFLVHNEWEIPEAILFYIFAGLAILFGGMMLTQRNPVHAALSFAMVVLSTCGLFLLQAAPFLMAATIIVYAGAIVVTFLFVIMLAQQSGQSSADQRSREPFLSTLSGFVLLAALLFVLNKTYSGPYRSTLEAFIERTEQALKGKSVKEWQELFGKDDAYFVDFRKFVSPTGNYRRGDVTRDALSSSIELAQLSWNTMKPTDFGEKREETTELNAQFKEQLGGIRQLAWQLRQNIGGLTPANNLPLSANSGTPPNLPALFEKDGKPVEQLPSANVAGLGKSLFTDYLLAVELAGTLLLVATIGAMAIAARREERLR